MTFLATSQGVNPSSFQTDRERRLVAFDFLEAITLDRSLTHPTVPLWLGRYNGLWWVATEDSRVSAVVSQPGHRRRALRLFLAGLLGLIRGYPQKGQVRVPLGWYGLEDIRAITARYDVNCTPHTVAKAITGFKRRA